MAVKTPIRTVFNASDVATGLAEYQSGEFIALAHGGIGASLSIGTAGQVLKVNSGASALEFASVEAVLNIDGLTDGSGITLAASDKLAVSDGGTEKYILASQIDTYVSGTSATLTNKTLTTPIIAEIDSGSTITLDATTDIVLDADGGDIFFKDGGTTFGSATNTSGNLIIKSGTTTALTMSGANVTVAGDLTVSGTTTTVDSTTINIQNSFVFEGATDDAYETTLTTVDPTADRTLSLPNATDTLVGKATTDTLTNKSIDLGNNTLTGSLAEWNSALQSESFTSLAGSETLTNKTLTSPVFNTGVSGSAVADEDDMSSDSATKLATQQSIKAYVDTRILTEDTLAELNDTNITSPGDAALIIYDTGTSTWRDYVVSGDITISDAGVGAIASGVIVNADVNSSAAIAFSKMANLTVSRLLVSDGSGDVSVSAVTSTEAGYLDGVTSAIQTQMDTKSTKAFAIAQAVALG